MAKIVLESRDEAIRLTIQAFCQRAVLVAGELGKDFRQLIPMNAALR
jgi:hypothetical protein